MPELPEVETLVRDLRESGLCGARITNVIVRWPRTIAGMSPRTFRARMKGRRIAAIGRRGKYVVITLDGGHTLCIHLRMTGRLSFAPHSLPYGAHDHVIVQLKGRRDLRYHDPRKFGRWTLTEGSPACLAALGPEPLEPEFFCDAFRKRLCSRKGMLKPLLLNQRFIAGLGNIYVDEALWEARLHPRGTAASLSAAEQRRLYAAIRRVLRRGVRSLGTTLGSGTTNFYSIGGRPGRNREALRVFRRTGLPCPRCATPVSRIVVSQRSTHLCPRCQKMKRA